MASSSPFNVITFLSLNSVKKIWLHAELLTIPKIKIDISFCAKSYENCLKVS